ncbi:MAG: helix-turn-helix domain-containing protein [Pseudomonadota bacterium]
MHTTTKLLRLDESRANLAMTDASVGACMACSAYKACLPGLFSAHEALQFEQLLVGRRRVARHASLYHEHDRFEMLYAVRYGQFKLLCRDSSGSQRVAQFYMPGDLVGLDAIATGRHRFRLMALENSEVCEIPYAAITKMMATEPAIQRRFLQSMSLALNEQHGRSSLLSLASLDERFASFLLQLGERYSRLGYSQKSFRLSMTRGDIGSYLGTTVESVSRLISRFNAQGAVAISGRTVDLLDRNYLLSILSSEDRPDQAGKSNQGGARH